MKKFLQILKSWTIRILKDKFLKFVLLKVVGSAAAGGPVAWVIKYIATEVFDEIGKPFIQAFFRELGYGVDKIDGAIKVEKLEKAKEENDQEAYDSAADAILK